MTTTLLLEPVQAVDELYERLSDAHLVDRPRRWRNSMEIARDTARDRRRELVRFRSSRTA